VKLTASGKFEEGCSHKSPPWVFISLELEGWGDEA
jgi:hypothetical protein